MELILEKTKEGRVLLRYENANYKVCWLDMERLLEILTSEYDLTYICHIIQNSVSNYCSMVLRSDILKLYYDGVIEDACSLIDLSMAFSSLNAEEMNSISNGYVGEREVLLRLELNSNT